MTGTTPALEFNPFLPEVHANPYPLYQRLRTQDPVHHSETGFWVLTRHADAATVLRDPRMSRDPRRSAQFQLLRAGDGQDPFEDGAPSMLFVDPPTTPDCGHW
jgi:cytochrome P450